ncbi:hypothetical protein F4Z99_11125 [Candidatus Poribacteria bacterium]|nr:hypothetical protein [Candidatus Poribacteria bacterium]MYA99513.1 hypothetical protein [Candidatus Poribacteria bacterium]
MKKKPKPVDISSVTTYPLQDRINKVSVHDFATLPESKIDLSSFLASLPKTLKASDFLSLVDDIVAAYQNKKPVIVMMGGHVIKCGLSPLLITLAKRGVITGFAFNGASSIHDFEIALIGETSEDVSAYLQTGKFGMWEETGQLMNTAIQRAADTGSGMGEALGKQLIEMDAPYNTYSLLAAGVQYDIPITVHVAIGTDIIHQHPSANGAAIGAASFTDFQLLTALVTDLEGGGVVLNLGSAVILPEVFLKALTIARNLGRTVSHFTAANFDMNQQYRPVENVVKRPTEMGGKGYTFTGHHELMIPLLVQAVLSHLQLTP